MGLGEKNQKKKNMFDHVAQKTCLQCLTERYAAPLYAIPTSYSPLAIQIPEPCVYPLFEFRANALTVKKAKRWRETQQKGGIFKNKEKNIGIFFKLLLP